ncbi:MAG: carboxypeptidase-like regulatory domain-containing protein [Planctomycetota bacterium]
MTQRRLVFLLLALIVGAVYWRFAGEERLGTREFMRAGAAVEPALDAGYRPLDAVKDRPALVETEVRRTLIGSKDEPALGDAVTRAMRADVAMLTGRVVGERGDPLSGVAVHAVAGVRNEDAVENGYVLARTEVATTDALGVFQSELRAGPAWLSLRAPGFAPAIVSRILVAPGGTTLEDDIVLQRSAVVTGVVLDDTGAPLENARVAVLESIDTEEHRTDSDGAFRFDQLQREPITLFASHVDHTARTIEIDASQPVQLPPVSIRLPRGDVIEGRLQGFPQAAKDAWRVVAIHPYAGRAIRYEDRMARVDATGHFRLRGLAAGESWQIFALPASKVDDSPTSRAIIDERVSELLTVESGDRQVVLNWEADSTISFRVVDASTQEPIEWLDVQCGLGIHQRAPKEHLREYEDGVVRIEERRFYKDHPPMLHVAAVGYEPWLERKLTLEARLDLDLGTIELLPAIRMRVTVLDAGDDQPVVGALVGWSEQDLKLGAEFASALAEMEDDARPAPWRRRSPHYSKHPVETTDEHGRVTFEGRAGYIVELTAMAPGFASAHVIDWKLPDAGDAERVLRLEPGGGVDVLALAAAGTPLVGRTIEHRLSGLNWPMGRGSGLPWNLDPERSERVTDAEGRAHFRDLAPGGHEFRIAPREDAGAFRHWSSLERLQQKNAWWTWTEIAVGANEVSELELTEAPRGTLVGRLTEHGQPVARARLGLFAESYPGGVFVKTALDTGANSVSTDAGGRYRIDDVEPGAYVLRIQPPDERATFDFELRVPAGETQHDVELGGATLAGRVVDPNGKGVADAVVMVAVSDERKASTLHRLSRQSASDFASSAKVLGGGAVRTDASGAWEIGGLQPGVPLVALAGGSDSDWQPVWSEELTLNVSERRDDVVLVVQPAGSLVVRLPDGANGFFVSLTVSRVVGTKTDRVRGDMDGNIGRVHALAPGPWTVTVRLLYPRELTEERQIEIVAGQATSIDVVLPD